MKNKIFALIVCTACLLGALTACSGAGACTTCQDLDKNNKCDVCGTPVVTIVEKVPTEEEVKETVVNPIPENVKLSDVYNMAIEKEIIPADAKLVDAKDGSKLTEYGRLIRIEYTEIVSEDEENPANNVFHDVIKLYDPKADKVVLTFDSGNYTAETEQYKTEYEFKASQTPVEPIRYIAYEIVTTSYEKLDGNDYYSRVVGYTYYTFGLELIVDNSEVSKFSYGARGEMLQITVDGIIYLIDPETEKVAYTVNEDEFVDRPEFDAVRGNYGFVYNESKQTVSVFDLTKWLDCTYNYTIPGYYAYPSVFYLENGNVLVQGLVATPATSANYDVLVSGVKYDVVYTVVNPAEKTATDVEFGYYIENLSIAEEGTYQSAVKNLAAVKSLDAKQLGTTRYFLLDNNLNIIADFDLGMPAFTEDFEVIANNRMLITLKYGEGSTVRKIVDGNGTVIATLPNSAVVKDGYIKVGNKYYNFDMKLVLDIDAEEFAVSNEMADYLLLSKEGDYYYWSLAVAAPVLVVDDLDDSVAGTVKAQSIAGGATETGFVVRTITSVIGENPSNTTVYTLYNANGVKVVETESYINYNSYREMYALEGVYLIKVNDSTWYVAK